MTRTVTSLVWLLLTAAAAAAQDRSPVDPPEGPDVPWGPVSPESLSELGFGLQRLPQSFNDLLRADNTAELRKLAQTFVGRPTTFKIGVTRVTEREVLFEILGRQMTRIAIRHDTLPPYGNLRSVYYTGGPTTERGNLLSTKLGLRIGDEISLDVARKLRYGDRLDFTGTIERMILNIDGWLTPQAIAVVGDFEVEVEPPPPSILNQQ